MMVQNNPTPWVVFALITMAMCGVLGMMLGLNPFGPSQEVRDQAAQTEMGLTIRGTENAISAMETLQAIYVQQTAVAAQLTAIPVQQIATQVAGSAEVESAQVHATQTAIAGEALNRQLADHATQTAVIGKQQIDILSNAATATSLAQDRVRGRATENAGFVAIGFGANTLCLWIIIRALIQVTHTRTEEKRAQAQFLSEQRRMVALRASLKNHNGHRPSHSMPNSLMQNKTDITDKPRGVE
jgi:hypothetical protein